MSIKKKQNQRQRMSQQPKRTRCVSIPSVTKNLLTRFVLLLTSTTAASVMSLNWCSEDASTHTNRKTALSLLNRRNRWKNCSKGITSNLAPLFHLCRITQWSNGASIPNGALLRYTSFPIGMSLCLFLTESSSYAEGLALLPHFPSIGKLTTRYPFFWGGRWEWPDKIASSGHDSSLVSEYRWQLQMHH